MSKMFDKYGWFTGNIPAQAVEDCTKPGRDAEQWVCFWIDTLDFIVPENLAREYLDEFGAWEDLKTADQYTLASRVFWIACGDISENGEWLGMVH